MKRSQIIFSTLLIPIDLCAIIFAAVLAYYVRFNPETFSLSIALPSYLLYFKDYLKIVLLIAPAGLGIFALHGLYTLKKIRFGEEFFKAFSAISIGTMGVIFIVFMLPGQVLASRFIILSTWFLSIIFVSFGRIVTRFIQIFLYSRGYGCHKLVLIGSNGQARNIQQEIREKPGLGYRIIAKISDYQTENSHIFKISDVLDRLTELIERPGIDEILHASPRLSQRDTLRLIDFCQEKKIRFKFSPNLFETATSNVDTEEIAGIPVVELKETPLDGWGKVYKRLFDIAGATAGIIIFSPIMLAISLAIRLDSPGPAFFRYSRVGKYGQPFPYFKFRSMKDETHYLKFTPAWRRNNLRKRTPLYKFKNDPRITRVGKFIRKHTLDELPELFLVFLGRMSLVGPRPHEVKEVAQYKKHHKKVLTLKPGMTGLAQISGRSDLDFEEEVKLDAFYIENWSPLLDLKILFKTPFILFRKRKAL